MINEKLDIDLSDAFTRQSLDDRIESVMLTRYTYTCFKNWDMRKLIAEAVNRGICARSETAELLDEYCKFLAIAGTIDPNVQPTGKVRRLWNMHKETGDYAEMCKTFSCPRMLETTDRPSSVQGLYAIVFSSLPAVWR